ncbi:MAG TPA: DUF2231 domain-containing protein [Thermopolyspora sp.]|jgi:hypothetical protein
MFDEIMGLPAHPLIIHAAVVFTPLLAVLAAGYALMRRWRRRLSWAVVLLAVVAPVSVFAARQSGMALEERLFGGQEPRGVLGQRVLEHETFATPLLLSTIGLAVLALLLVYFTVREGGAENAEARHASASGAGSASAGRIMVTMVLSVITVVLALVVLYFVLRAGHSGATAVWAS